MHPYRLLLPAAALLLVLALSFSSAPAAQPLAPHDTVLINEVDADTSGTDAAEFVELYDGGAGNTPLDGLALVFYNGSSDAVYHAFDLDGYSTNEHGYFVLCGNAALVANCDMDVTPDSDLIQNGADAVALYTGDAASFPNGSPLTTLNLLDALVYDTSDPDDPGLLVLLNAGQPQVDENGLGEKDTHSNQRCPDGGVARNTDTYTQHTPTPGASNCPPVEFGNCGDPATPIHAVQGSGAASPLDGSWQVVEALVSGDFQGSSPGLGGFFVQEEAADADADPLTSEGLFVYDGDATASLDVSPGDLVRLLGVVDEYYSLTELHSITAMEICGSGVLTPSPVSLPLASLDVWERYEGMLVDLDQTLYVSGNYTLGRYGELDLSVGSRLQVPTNVVAPGAPALALQDLNDRSRIQLDDGSNRQNPLPLPPYLDLGNTRRLGDTLEGLTGVLGFSFGDYEIHPTQPLTFTQMNVRPAEPPSGRGDLKVASFNVLNYFTTIDGGLPICGPEGSLECRGADSLEEFERQRLKIISALSAIEADIFGLVEIENNASEAVQNLVEGLNDVLGAGTYAFIDSGTIGTDAIKVALVYKPDKVTPVGSHAVLDSTVDPEFIDVLNRPTLAQTFETPLGERFTLAVNHFKSKGSPCDDFDDPDLGDGQGNCNLTRTRAAEALARWLAADPTGSGDPDFLIIGDLNSYAMEDPIAALQDAGYTNLLYSLVGASAYSYVFDGQTGYLDHALASGSLLGKVTQVIDWHINADEPTALDYNDYNQPDLYSPDAYRASDHDPLVVYLGFESQSQLFMPLVSR